MHTSWSLITRLDKTIQLILAEPGVFDDVLLIETFFRHGQHYFSNHSLHSFQTPNDIPIRTLPTTHYVINSTELLDNNLKPRNAQASIRTNQTSKNK